MMRDVRRALFLVLLIQRLELLVLWRRAAAAGHVDDHHHFPGVLRQFGVLAVQRLHVKIQHRGHISLLFVFVVGQQRTG